MKYKKQVNDNGVYVGVEELYEQKQFEIKDREEKEMKIAEMQEQLNLVRNLNDHLDNELDKKIEQLDNVWCAVNRYKTGKCSRELAFSDVMSAIDYRW